MSGNRLLAGTAGGPRSYGNPNWSRRAAHAHSWSIAAMVAPSRPPAPATVHPPRPPRAYLGRWPRGRVPDARLSCLVVAQAH